MLVRARLTSRPVLAAARSTSASRGLCTSLAERVTNRLGRVWRPRRIILIRHGQSAGNVDEAAYTSTPDWRIPLTPHGVEQAKAVGVSLRDMIGPSPDANAYFYVSPYCRAKETLEHVLAALDPPRVIGVREDPRCTEQQFGNLQDRATMEQAKRDRRAFGRFFYRFPQGESALDVYARVTSFISTIFRDEAQLRDSGRMTSDTHLVVVAHGLFIQLFVMRWFQMTVEEFELLSNPPNGSAVVLERQGTAGSSQWYEISPASWKLLDARGELGWGVKAGAHPGDARRNLVQRPEPSQT